jgi:hypothetical protein
MQFDAKESRNIQLLAEYPMVPPKPFANFIPHSATREQEYNLFYPAKTIEVMITSIKRSA